MATDKKDLLEKLRTYRTGYRSATARNSGVATAKAALMNTLFNHLDEIISALAEDDKNTERISSLTEALQEADEEYRELNEKYKALMASSTPKKKAKQGE